MAARQTRRFPNRNSNRDGGVRGELFDPLAHDYGERIPACQQSRSVMHITWFGHSAFRLDFAERAVLIDPFFTGNPAYVSDKAAAIKGVEHIVLTNSLPQ
jgi:Beta-lactamase superfamily domain